MGTSASCSIVLAPTGKPFYWAGETISGNVILTIKKSVNLQSIRALKVAHLIQKYEISMFKTSLCSYLQQMEYLIMK